MLMPTVFHENLFDDFFDPFWNDAALERAMNREARGAFGKRGANMMKTDVKQTDNGYEVAVDLPGCKKEDGLRGLEEGEAGRRGGGEKRPCPKFSNMLP